MFKLPLVKLIAMMASVTITIHAKTVDHSLSFESLLGIIGPQKPKVVFISCTGVYVAPNTVLTANHCVEDLWKDSLWIKDGNKTYSAKPVFTNKKRDLALLRVAAPKHEYTTLGDPLDISDWAYSVNSGYDMIGTFTQGYIENIVNDEDTNELQYVTSLGIAQGASGGGMFNRNGELVGIMVQTLRNAPISFAMETSVVQAFLIDGQQFIK